MVKTSQPQKGILQITLNRPEQLNALNEETLLALSKIFQDAKADTSVKAILLHGEGKGFCAGADIKKLAELNGQTGLQFALFGQSVFRQLETLGKPSLAAIHGYALGGGLELAMAASLRIAAKTAQFGQPEIKLGVIPGFGGTQRLARLVGKGRALDLCLTGRKVKADEALQMGLVSELTEPDAVVQRGLAILTEVSNYSSVALQQTMRAIDEGYNLSLTEGLALEAAYFGICCSTNDKQEGVSAFLEKRVPSFQGM